jgi:hypothetical protein
VRRLLKLGDPLPREGVLRVGLFRPPRAIGMGGLDGLNGQRGRPRAVWSQALTGVLPLLLENILLPADDCLSILEVRFPAGCFGTDQVGPLRCESALRFFPLMLRGRDLLLHGVQLPPKLLAALF